MQNFDSERDISRQRSIDLENGNKINITQTDPFGFWTISYNKGQLPDHMRGQYTSYHQAELAVQQYLQTKR